MEPITLLGLAAKMMAQRAAGVAEAGLLRSLGIGQTPISASQIEAVQRQVSALLEFSLNHDMHAGLALYRQAMRETDLEARRAAAQAAEHHLIEAADNPALPASDRALAAYWASVCASDRGAKEVQIYWLLRSNSLMADTLGNHAWILSSPSSNYEEPYPDWLSEEVRRQQAQRSAWQKIAGQRVDEEPLRRHEYGILREEREFWIRIREILDSLERGQRNYTAPLMYGYWKSVPPSLAGDPCASIVIPLSVGKAVVGGNSECTLHSVRNTEKRFEADVAFNVLVNASESSDLYVSVLPDDYGSVMQNHRLAYLRKYPSLEGPTSGEIRFSLTSGERKEIHVTYEVTDYLWVIAEPYVVFGYSLRSPDGIDRHKWSDLPPLPST